MLLTCPSCRSGLQVPDGTTAYVRCPGCKAIFPAAAGLAPVLVTPPPSAGTGTRPPFGQAAAPPPPKAKPAPAPPPPKAKPAPPGGLRPPLANPRPGPSPDRFRPQGPRPADEPDVDTSPPPPARRQRYDDPDGLTADERADLRAAFGRGMWGSRLIALGFALQGVALLIVVLFLARNAIWGPAPGLLVAAGVAGLAAWAVGAVGVGMALAGPASPGHLGFGIGAAVAVGVHGILLMALVSQRPERTGLMGQVPVAQADLWGQLPTKFDAVTLYLAIAAYPEEQFLIRRTVGLAIAVGVAELVRLIFVTMLLSCLARAAGDEEVVHRCVRAGGIGSLGPGTLAVVMFLLFGLLVESGAIERDVGTIVVSVAVMGVYAILGGLLVPALMAARDTADACEYPFQTAVIDLGG